MSDDVKKPDANLHGSFLKRPFTLSLLCVFSWTSYGFMGLLYLLGLIYRDWITEVIGQYIPDTGWSGIRVTLFFLSGFLLHAFAVTGVIFVWKLRRVGYPMLIFPSLLIAIFYLFSQDISWVSIGSYLFMVVLFSLFYPRMG